MQGRIIWRTTLVAAALAEALAEYASLEVLNFVNCGVGGAGFEVVTAVVPRWPKLRDIICWDNPGPSDALGRALLEALPSLLAGGMVWSSYGMSLERSGLSEGVAEELRAAKAAAGSGE